MTDFKERIGDQKLSIDKIAIAIEGKEMAVLEGMDVDGKSDVPKTVRASILSWITP